MPPVSDGGEEGCDAVVLRVHREAILCELRRKGTKNLRNRKGARGIFSDACTALPFKTYFHFSDAEVLEFRV